MFALILATMLQSVGSVEPSAAKPQPRSKAERNICRAVEVTGSRMGRSRVCKSASEWQIDKQAAEKFLTGKQNMNLEDPARMGPPAPQ